MLNARNEYKFHCACRIVAMSYDGADTFPIPHISVDTALIEPACAAGLLYHQGIMFFVNPKNASKRKCTIYSVIFLLVPMFSFESSLNNDTK